MGVDSICPGRLQSTRIIWLIKYRDTAMPVRIPENYLLNLAWIKCILSAF